MPGSNFMILVFFFVFTSISDVEINTDSHKNIDYLGLVKHTYYTGGK
jgi:hypothetical protein